MTNDSVIKVLLADDHRLVREGIAASLNRRAGISVVAEAANGREAIELFRRAQPDVVILDLQMPVLGGAETIAGLRREAKDVRVLVLTTFDGDEDIHRALKAGALGYLLKEATGDELADAVRQIHAGRKFISPAVGLKLAERFDKAELTARETEVLREMATGKTNEEIARALNVSLATVKTHVAHLLDKLEARDRSAAVVVALKRGIVRF